MIAPAFAQTDIDLSEFGTSLGEKLGIGAFAGGLLMGLIFEAVILFPLTMISRRKGSGYMAEMIFGLGVFGLNIAMGWWPVWMIIILCFLIALLFGKDIADAVGR